MQKLRAFLADQTAATSIEYAIIASGVAGVLIAVVYGMGPKLNTTFSSVSTQLK
ncbi:MAG TPA: Flp family type IVb pilin [Pseudolabrys sp.]|nr:Flp family type IVb pilin [Pseudolabrys sp.]